MNVQDRRYDIDWLRIFAMIVIFLFHCARFFNNEDWHVKNNQLNFGMSVFVGIIAQWIMPLFFVLSAMSTYYALSYRKDKQYIGERFKRLVIPLMFGAFVLIPPQVYIERVTHSQFVGSFFEFFPHYFDGLYGFGGNFTWMGLHLWYLEFLFAFSLLMLPIFRYFRSKAMQDFICRAAVFFAKPGAVFLLAIPIGTIELLINLQPEGIGRRDFGGWSLLVYLVFFIVGYLVASDTQFKESIENHRIAAMAMGIITTTVGFFLLESGYSSRTYLFAFLRAFNSWFWLVAILGFGSKHFTFNNALLKYANEAVLPFYILHQTVIVILGYYIADWNGSVIIKYIVISTASFVLIIALYDLAIKRANTLRFLFGMKSK